MKFLKSEERKKVVFGNDDVEMSFRKRLGYFEKKELESIKIGGIEIQDNFKPRFKNPEEAFAQIETEKALLKRLALSWTKENFKAEAVIEYLGDEENFEFAEEIINYLREQNGLSKNKDDSEKKQDTQN